MATTRFPNLIAARKAFSNAAERTALSKRIRRFLRNQLRAKRNRTTTDILARFRNLSELEILKFDPIRMGRKHDELTPSSLQFSEFLADIFHSGRDGADTFTGTYRGHSIPPFCLDELHQCLTGMRTNNGKVCFGNVSIWQLWSTSSAASCFKRHVVHGNIRTELAANNYQHVAKKWEPR